LPLIAIGFADECMAIRIVRMDTPIRKHGHSQALFELDPARYAGIGEVVTKFAALEFNLTQIMYMLVGVDRRIGRLAIKTDRAGDILVIIRDLMALKKMKLQPPTNDYRERFRDAAEFRNLVAHGSWVVSRIDCSPKILETRGNSAYPENGSPINRRTRPEGRALGPTEFAIEIKKLDDLWTETSALGMAVIAELGITPQSLRPPIQET
jgi:hypothetical protein